MITNLRHYFAHLLAASAVVSLLAARHAAAEVTYTETEGENKQTVIRLTVTPAAEPVPAMKYRLVAEESDIKSGNAAPFYYRAMLRLPETTSALDKEFGENWSSWYHTGVGGPTISELPLDKLRKAVELTRSPIDEQLADAIVRRNCDWQLGIENVRGPEVISFLLPELSESRSLSRLIVLRTRLAIAENRHDAAVRSMRMNYRLAADSANIPFLVNGLVGIAEASMTNATVIEAIAAKNSPNLYWALTELSQPLIDLRPAVRSELNMPKRMFPLIENASTVERTHEEWNALLKQVAKDLPKISGQPYDLPQYEMAMTGMALVAYPHAKARLIAQGMDPARVEQMPVGQVIAIYSEQICDRISHEYEKLWYLPFSEMRIASAKVKAKLDAAHPLRGGPDREVIPMMTLLLPALESVRDAQVRLEREIASLRVIEALRIYAAAHDHQLPAKLADITEVPIPPNPATGQPFIYRLENNTAILELPASDGIRNQNRRYEITIQQN